MIYKKSDSKPFSHNRYEQSFEYMFVISKGRPSTFNGIKDKPNKYADSKVHGTSRMKDGSTKRIHGHNNKFVADFGLRHNVWSVIPVKSSKVEHPAVFPLRLAKDHIISWSNEGDTVLDPLMGSGTTGVAALELNRKFIGIEISSEYVELAKKRINHERNNSPDISAKFRDKFRGRFATRRI
jgi:site-specific DNA-methyltransferase (adenine-specific)